MADRELLRGAEYWRDRGEKARTFAEQMREKRANETMLHSEWARQQLLELASMCDAIANMAEGGAQEAQRQHDQRHGKDGK